MMRLQRAAREGWEGATAGALARSVVDLFPSFFYSSSSSSDDDDYEDEEEEEDTKLEADDMFEKTTTTTVEKNDDKNKKDKKRTMKRQTMKLRLFAEDFLYFSLVNVVSENRTRKSDIATTTVEAFRRYAVAGAISTALMLPFDIVTLQMKKIEAKMKKKGKASSSKSSNSKNRMKVYVSAMKEAYKRDGALAFQRGFSQNVPLIVSHAINLAAFDALKALKTKYGVKKLSIIESFVIGCLSKTIATGITFPLERTRALVEASKSFHREEEENSVRRNMVDGEYLNSSDTTSKEKKNMNSNSSSNTLDVVQLVLESQGICGFYDGVIRHVQKSVHASALFFVIREQMRNRR
jgi:hypothetical protein